MSGETSAPPASGGSVATPPGGERSAPSASSAAAEGSRREDPPRERRPVQGLLVIVSAPSGAGKDAVLEKLVPLLEDATVYVTATSRAPRPGEVHGKHYFFYSPQKFREEIEQGNFLEWSVVHGEYKGVRGDAVAETLDRHRIVIVKPDPQGMRKLKAGLPEALTIFIQPPDLDSLRRRLIARGTETPESIEVRMKNAEIEMAAAPEYDHVVVNADGELEETVRRVAEIVRKEARHPRTYWL